MDKVYIIIFILIGIIVTIKLFVKPKQHEGFEGFEGIKVLRSFNKKLEKIHKRFDSTKNTYTLKDDPKKKLIKNNIIVITGATSGIGYEIAKMVNNYKPILIVCGKKPYKVNKLVKELKKKNEDVYGIAQDMTVKDGPNLVFKKIKEHVNKVDILINNSIIKRGSESLLSKNEADWLEEVSLNVNANILLSKKIAQRMKTYGVKGRIINISNSASNSNDNDTYSSSEIITTSMIEKFSQILAKELFQYNIGSTIVRIDNDIEYNADQVSEIFESISGTSPKKIMPVFLYAIKSPLQEISGKIISTNSYLQNPNISKIVSSNPMKIADTVKDFSFTKHKKNKKYKYLVKQNPYKPSPNIKKVLNSNNLNNINDVSKYKSKLQKLIANNLNIDKDNIVFFKNEYESIKRLVDIFVPKNHEIITHEPTWNYLKLLELENKFTLVYSTLKVKNKKLVLDYNSIYSLINTNTKLIYISSPNIVSGQSIDIKQFEKFIGEIPNNIIVLLDQRYIEFSSKLKLLDGCKYIEKYKNLIVLRTFNNFYSIENLELTYILTNLNLAEFISDTIILNQIDRFSENLALSVYNDNYYNKVKNKIINEKNRFIKKLRQNEIKHFDTETNFLLVKTSKSKDDISDSLEEKKILLYVSDDYYNYYWTLPLNTKEVNDAVMEVLMYADL